MFEHSHNATSNSKPVTSTSGGRGGKRCTSSGTQLSLISNPNPDVGKRATRKLRDYQREAVNAVLEQISTRSDNNPTRGRHTAVVLPTGTGKSTVAAQTIIELVKTGKRVILISHRVKLVTTIASVVTELITPHLTGFTGAVTRNAKKYSPGFTPDFFDPFTMIYHANTAASLHSIPDEVRVIVTTASVLMAGKPAATKTLADLNVNSVIIDECHHVEAQNYHTILSALGCNVDPRKGYMPPHSPPLHGKRYPDIIGFTATFRREAPGESLLTVFDSIAYHKDITWAIKNGYLVTPRSVVVPLPALNVLSQVKTRTLNAYQDFSRADLAKVMHHSADTIAASMVKHIPTASSIVFCVDKQHAQQVCQALKGTHFTPRILTGDTPHAVREKIFREFETNVINCIVTVDVLTEGVDLPCCDAVVIARPTKSRTLYTQMVGRALRPYGEKDEAIVVDFAPTTGRDIVLKASTALPKEIVEEKSGGGRPQALLLKPTDNPWSFKNENAVTANPLLFPDADGYPNGGWNTITINNSITYFQLICDTKNRGCLYAAVPYNKSHSKYVIVRALLADGEMKHRDILTSEGQWSDTPQNTLFTGSLTKTIMYLNEGINSYMNNSTRKWWWHPNSETMGVVIPPRGTLTEMGFVWTNTSDKKIPAWYAVKNFGETIALHVLTPLVVVDTPAPHMLQ